MQSLETPQIRCFKGLQSRALPEFNGPCEPREPENLREAIARFHEWLWG